MFARTAYSPPCAYRCGDPWQELQLNAGGTRCTCGAPGRRFALYRIDDLLQEVSEALFCHPMQEDAIERRSKCSQWNIVRAMELNNAAPAFDGPNFKCPMEAWEDRFVVKGPLFLLWWRAVASKAGRCSGAC